MCIDITKAENNFYSIFDCVTRLGSVRQVQPKIPRKPILCSTDFLCPYAVSTFSLLDPSSLIRIPYKSHQQQRSVNSQSSGSHLHFGVVLTRRPPFVHYKSVSHRPNPIFGNFFLAPSQPASQVVTFHATFSTLIQVYFCTLSPPRYCCCCGGCLYTRDIHTR